MVHRFSLAVAAFLCAMPFQAAADCVLPVPDGGDIEPSTPSLVGVISSVVPGGLVVRTSLGTLTHVLLNDQTGLWTVYGGGVDAAQLRQGQHALIWFEHCAQPRTGRGVAAVVEICSLAAEPCPMGADIEAR